MKILFHAFSLLLTTLFPAFLLSSCTPSTTIYPSGIIVGSATTMNTDVSSDTAKEKWFGGAEISLNISVSNTSTPFAGAFTYTVTSNNWENGVKKSTSQSISGSWSETNSSIVFGGKTYKLASLTDSAGSALSLTVNSNQNSMWFYSNSESKSVAVLIGNTNFKIYMAGTLS